MATEADAARAAGASRDDAVLHERFFGDPDRVPALALVRPRYHGLFDCITMKEALKASAADVPTFKPSQNSGLAYGETAIESVWRILRGVDLSVFTCTCSGDTSAAAAPERERCAICGRRRVGAHILDLGSGIGNVVVAFALLAAAGEARGQVARVEGVELLPRLHAVAEAAVRTLLAQDFEIQPPARPLPLPLPHCAVRCGDLMTDGENALADADLVYMTTTLFDDDFLARFAVLAADTLRSGSRVVTLSTPLQHEAFETEARIPICNSWGEEAAVVNVRR